MEYIIVKYLQISTGEYHAYFTTEEDWETNFRVLGLSANTVTITKFHLTADMANDLVDQIKTLLP